ncbi:hypothetical protein LRY65_03495 [Candidatus Woesebacteria bacterium]|nr:hypothetical protein [Candidatus Woesebacteria bacterium]
MKKPREVEKYIVADGEKKYVFCLNTITNQYAMCEDGNVPPFCTVIEKPPHVTVICNSRGFQITGKPKNFLR